MALTIIERNVQLDVYDHDLTPSKIKAIALDSETRYVGAEIHNGGQTYDVGQNTGVKLTIIRPDKTGVQVTGSTFQYTVGDGETVYGAYAELTQTALAVSGTLKAQFMLTSGDQILRTEIFSINNGVALDAEVSEWAGEYQGYNLDELVQNVNESSAKVDAMEQDVSDLKSGFKATGLESTPYIERHNGMMNGAGSSWMYTTNTKYQHIVLPVTSGQFFKITQGTAGNSFWAFLKSYSTESAPDLSTGTSSRQNSSTEMLVPDDANYLYVNVNNNGTVTIPKVLIVGDWDFSATAKSQLLANVENVYNCMLRNTPIAIINGNRIPISKTSFASGTVNIGFEEPDTITLGGSYSSGAQRVTLNTGTLKANTKYTFFVKNTDGLIPAVGLADSNGFITYNSEKVETTKWNSAIVFETGNSALTGVYAYLRRTSSALNNKLSIYVIEGELKEDDFYIYDKKYVNSRLFGKKVAWYGDSITQGYGWCSAINSLFDFVGTNCGSGGSRISYTDTRDDSMCLTSRMQGNYTPTSGTATAIPNDVDIIFVEGGTNDWGNSVTVGNPIWKETVDNTIFSEACNEMFDNLTTLFPNAEIIVLGSPWAKWANHFTNTYGILNNNGLQTVDYGDLLLDVAGRWGIKGINMSRLIAFNDNNIASLTSDGIHPNASGAKVIADVVANYLLSL